MAHLIDLQRRAGNIGTARTILRLPDNEDVGANSEPGMTRADIEHAREPLTTTRPTGALQRGVDDHFTTAATTPRPIQRVPTQDSHPTLVQNYMSMMRSRVFRDLDVRATRRGPIRLIDSSTNGRINYDHATHSIQIPATQPTNQLRSSLLFEMHHAADADAGMHIIAKAEEVHDKLTEENAYLKPYVIATFALSTEWIEWNRIAEACLRGIAIDHELGGGQILKEWERSFTAPGRGWFVFDNYLRDQIMHGHTSLYDPQAQHRGWVGREILAQVRRENSLALLITQAELNEFVSIRRKNIKHADDNPFRADKAIDKIKLMAAAEIV